MKIVRVDMKNEKVIFENLPEEWKNIGGSALIAKIMNQRGFSDCGSPRPGESLYCCRRPSGGYWSTAAWAYIRRGQEPSYAGNKRGQLGRPSRPNPRPAGDSRDCCGGRTPESEAILPIDLQG